MMTGIFATLFAAFLLGWLNWRRAALLSLTICFGLSVWLFLFEIYSPETGFRMPWIQTEWRAASPAAA